MRPSTGTRGSATAYKWASSTDLCFYPRSTVGPPQAAHAHSRRGGRPLTAHPTNPGQTKPRHQRTPATAHKRNTTSHTLHGQVCKGHCDRLLRRQAQGSWLGGGRWGARTLPRNTLADVVVPAELHVCRPCSGGWRAGAGPCSPRKANPSLGCRSIQEPGVASTRRGRNSHCCPPTAALTEPLPLGEKAARVAPLSWRRCRRACPPAALSAYYSTPGIPTAGQPSGLHLSAVLACHQLRWRRLPAAWRKLASGPPACCLLGCRGLLPAVLGLHVQRQAGLRHPHLLLAQGAGPRARLAAPQRRGRHGAAAVQLLVEREQLRHEAGVGRRGRLLLPAGWRQAGRRQLSAAALASTGRLPQSPAGHGSTRHGSTERSNQVGQGRRGLSARSQAEPAPLHHAPDTVQGPAQGPALGEHEVGQHQGDAAALACTPGRRGTR